MDYTAQFTIQPSEIEQRVAGISLHKSPGPMAYQTGSCVILLPQYAAPLAAIFNASIQEGYFPPILEVS